MRPTLLRDAGLIAKKLYALIESRPFSSSSNACSSIASMKENERQKRLRRTNEEWHRKYNAYQRDYKRRMRETDPDFRKKDAEEHRERYATNSRYKLSCLISAWAGHDRWAWIFEELPWKTHFPLRYTNSVQRRCESCGLTIRRNPRLIWQSIAQPDLHSCHACYMKQEPEVFMPEGYEDIRGMRALVARKRQLDELNCEASRADSTFDGGKKIE